MKKFAVFDIDGTLIRWQLFHAIVGRLGNMGIMGNEFAPETKAVRMRWKKRQADTTFSDYEQIFVKRWQEEMHKVPYETYLTVVDEIINEYVEQVYIFTRDLIKKLKSEGYFLVAISGSPNEIVKRLADYYGFDDFIASDYQVGSDGNFTGKVNVPITEKDTHLKKLVKKHSLTWTDSVAVGDTHNDIKMLQLVEKPIAFNPDHKLAVTARERGWRIIVERKSVVYELGPDKWKIA